MLLIFDQPGIVVSCCPLERQIEQQVFIEQYNMHNNKTAFSLIMFILTHNEIVWK